MSEEISYSGVDVYGFKPKRGLTLSTKNTRGAQTIRITPGVCPCGVCNHRGMDDCNPGKGQTCKCCSEQCT